MKTTIGLQISGGQRWLGGINHLLIFVKAVKRFYKDSYRFKTVGSKQEVDETTRRIVAQQTGDMYVLPPQPRIFTKDWLINGLEYRFRGTNRQVEFFIKKNHIDIIFGYCIAYSCGSVPVLSWIPDFQHKHMPDLFSKSARRARDKNFAMIAKNAKRVVCMSNAVQDDFVSFFPRYKDKSFVLRSAADIEEEVFAIDPAKVAALYSLPERFIFVPNQFWKHKNHECVFKALHILKKKGEKLFVVFSGHENDYRDPEYFPSLMAYAQKADVEGMFISLGIIDYADVLQLMRQSICVLNPSLYEGFGLSVEEAKAVGKKVIVSDIPVFHEHNVPEALYFDPKSPAELAQKMLLVWNTNDVGPDTVLEEKVKQRHEERICNCATSFHQLIESVRL